MSIYFIASVDNCLNVSQRSTLSFHSTKRMFSSQGVKLIVVGEVTTKVTTTARPFTNATVTATDFAGLIDDPVFSDFAINVQVRNRLCGLNSAVAYCSSISTDTPNLSIPGQNHPSSQSHSRCSFGVFPVS